MAIRRFARQTDVLRRLITGIAIIATVQAIIGIIGLYIPLAIYSDFVNGLRAVGTFSSGNAMGGMLALSLPPTLAMAQLSIFKAAAHIRQRGAMHILHAAKREDYCLLWATLWLLATFFQLIALLLSGSRGAIFAAFISLSCLCFWFYRSRRSLTRHEGLPVAAAILTTLLVLLIGAGGTYAITIQRIKQLDSVHQSALPRTLIWKAVVQQALNRPFGAAPGRFDEVFTQFQPPGYGESRVYHAHNDYLEIMSETGIPGFLLLVTGMVMALKAAARRLLRNQSGTSIWIRRAALLSVLAGLIHATVDFNLSARPGVASLFFCLMGVALSHRPNAKQNTAHNLSPLQRRVVIIFCCLLAINQLRLATAMTLMQQGYAVITNYSSPYFFLPIPRLDRAAAFKRMRLAKWIAPDAAETHMQLARAIVIDSDSQLAQTITQTQSDYPDADPDTIAQQVRVLLRMDAHRALSQAYRLMERAQRLAPRDADVIAHTARITARLSGLTTEPTDVIATIHRTLMHIEQARRLAPNDISINRILLSSLPSLIDAADGIQLTRPQPTIQQTGKEIGLHLLNLGERDLQPILDAWSHLNLDAFEWLNNMGPLSADASVQLYRFYNRNHQPQAAIRSLDLLAIAIDNEQLSDTGFRSAQRKEALLDNYRFLLVRERARWHLRQHHFQEYQHSRRARTVLLRRDIEQKLADTSAHEAIARRFRYLKLRDLFDSRGLDPEHLRELATFMRQHSESKSTVDNVLSPLTAGDRPDGLDGEDKPDHEINIDFIGGRIVLRGFSIRDDTIETIWTFHSRVPSDLRTIFRFRDSDHKHAASAAFRFAAQLGRDFAVGAPELGNCFRVKTPLPALAPLSKHLTIGLYSRSKRLWLPTLEGLPRVDLYDWKALRSAPPPSHPDNASNPEALRIDKRP